MIIFPGNTIHGSGFKNLNSIGNYRIQIHIYDKYPHFSFTKNVYYKYYTFSNATKSSLLYIDLKKLKEILRHKIIASTIHHHHIRN